MGLYCLPVKEFYGTRYQSGLLFLNQCREWFSLPAASFSSLLLFSNNCANIHVVTAGIVIFCSYSLPADAPSTRHRSTQYVGRWWHYDSAVAAVNPCSVSVPVQYQCSRLYRPADQSVIQTSFSSSDLYSNSFVPTFPTCPTYLCVCNVCGFCPFER